MGPDVTSVAIVHAMIGEDDYKLSGPYHSNGVAAWGLGKMRPSNPAWTMISY